MKPVYWKLRSSAISRPLSLDLIVAGQSANYPGMVGFAPRVGFVHFCLGRFRAGLPDGAIRRAYHYASGEPLLG